MEALEREIDTLGRIVIPKSWRKQLGQHIILYRIGNEVRIKPKSTKKLSEFPKIEVALKAKLADWHAVKDELLE